MLSNKNLTATDFVYYDKLGNIHDTKTRNQITDWMAYVVSQNGVIGIYQGEAETGPRALGHRSLLSNPCNPKTLEILNSRVKLRERIRPLAPMVTLEDAKKWFKLSDGGRANHYDAYNYMVLTAEVTEEAKEIIPAVVHYDGTSRIQIVRPENNLLMYDYLKALGKYIGAEVSVNTSLNVGSPIVQTPDQALDIFKRAKGLDSIFMVGDEGDVFMVWAKEGVQKFDSNIPALTRAYFEHKTDKSEESFKRCFSKALLIETSSDSPIINSQKVSEKTITETPAFNHKITDGQQSKKAILLALKEQRISLIEAKQKLEQISTQKATGSFSSADHKKAPTVLNSVNDQNSVQIHRNNATFDAIAVIGMSGRFPDADNVHEFWENLKNGRNSVTEVPEERGFQIDRYFDTVPQTPGKTYTKWGGFLRDIDQFDASFFGITPKEAELMDPTERLFLQESWRAIEDAGYAPSSLTGKRWGVFACAKGDYHYLIHKQDETYLSQTDSLSPSRLSYLLNLVGPAISVDTACSSTLAAIAYACDSLSLGNCDVAIAGGGGIYTTPNALIGSSQASLFSADGKCYTFDHRANGTVLAEAIGSVVLKPLTQAIQDGDHIYGVLKGWGTNQDGKTNGITAPSVTSQIQLLTETYQKFDINPEQITMVEAHGTGTKLGDPIEVQALIDSFQKFTQKTGYCALGTLKTNIGHAFFGSGVTALIKVLLSLKHSQIPASLNFEKINPYIPIENSPFFVNTSLKSWVTESNQPRCAAINAFGATGINVHLVVEEYDSKNQELLSDSFSVSAKESYLIVLSAKNEERLHKRAEELYQFLLQTPSDTFTLLDIAYTLQVGRDAMEERMGLIVSSIEELNEKLDGFLEGQKNLENLYRGNSKRHKEALALLSGDDDLTKIIDIWVEKGKYSKLLDYWVKGLAFDWNRLYQDNRFRKPARMSLPSYPFSNERYWWSGNLAVSPPVPVHAVNNNNSTAVTTALHPLLHQNTSDFAEQRFSSTFTGNEFFLADHQIKRQKVFPGVAYLEMAREAVTQATDFLMENHQKNHSMIRLKNIVWMQPIVVTTSAIDVHIGLFLENHSDQSMPIHYDIYTESEDAESVVHSQGIAVLDHFDQVPSIDIEYLRNQMNQGRLSREQCYEAFQTVGFDYGPGYQGIDQVYIGNQQALTKHTLPSSVLETYGDQFVLHPSLMDSALQSSIGLLVGVNSQDNHSTSLNPPLPFALEELEIYAKCPASMWTWIRYSEGSSSTDKVQKLDFDLCDEQGQVCVRMKGFSSRVLEKEMNPSTESLGMLLCRPVWKQVVAKKTSHDEYSQHIVMLCEPNAVSTKPFFPVQTVSWGESSVIRLQSEEQTLSNRYQDISIQAFQIIKELFENKPKHQTLVQILIPSQETVKDFPEQVFSGLSGLLKTAQLENAKILGQLIEVESTETEDGLVKKIQENSQCPFDNQIRYRQNQREVIQWEEVPVTSEATRIPWKDDGIYLITGGAGGLGLIFATEIASKTKNSVLILTGRSRLSSEKQNQLKAIESLGARIVEYRQMDVTQKNEVEALIQRIEEEFGAVNGILQSAGLIRDNFILKKTADEFKAVLGPKVVGTVNLDQATQNHPLDFFILFSSGASVWGNFGQADYSTANAFMDAFAQYRQAQVALKKTPR
jgi:polyketide synthase PksN